MAIDFTLTPELEDIRDRVRTFIAEVVKPAEDEIDGHGDHEALTGKARIEKLIELRKLAFKQGLWLPHMPEDWGGMGLAMSSLPWCRPKRRRATTARGCSTVKPRMRATCTRCCTGAPTSRRRPTSGR